MQKLIDFLAGSRKAIVGFVVATVVAYLAKHGVNGDMSLNSALTALVNGVVGFITVYLIPNKQ